MKTQKIKIPAIVASLFLLASIPHTAFSKESLYPGDERLLIGDRVDVVAHNFDWLNGCRYSYDFRDFLAMLKAHSKTDWRYFKTNGARSGVESEGCTQNSMKDTAIWLDRYLAEIKKVANACADMPNCAQAGRWFSPTTSPDFRPVIERSR